jgi:hypothetical protein
MSSAVDLRGTNFIVRRASPHDAAFVLRAPPAVRPTSSLSASKARDLAATSTRHGSSQQSHSPPSLTPTLQQSASSVSNNTMWSSSASAAASVFGGHADSRPAPVSQLQQQRQQQQQHQKTAQPPQTQRAFQHYQSSPNLHAASFPQAPTDGMRGARPAPSPALVSKARASAASTFSSSSFSQPSAAASSASSASRQHGMHSQSQQQQYREHFTAYLGGANGGAADADFPHPLSSGAMNSFHQLRSHLAASRGSDEDDDDGSDDDSDGDDDGEVEEVGFEDSDTEAEAGRRETVHSHTAARAHAPQHGAAFASSSLPLQPAQAGAKPPGSPLQSNAAQMSATAADAVVSEFKLAMAALKRQRNAKDKERDGGGGGNAATTDFMAAARNACARAAADFCASEREFFPLKTRAMQTVFAQCASRFFVSFLSLHTAASPISISRISCFSHD